MGETKVVAVRLEDKHLEQLEDIERFVTEEAPIKYPKSLFNRTNAIKYCIENTHDYIQKLRKEGNK